LTRSRRDDPGKGAEAGPPVVVASSALGVAGHAARTDSRPPEPAREPVVRRVTDGKGTVEYALVRRRGRRRITILVHPQKGVEVRAGLGTPLREIETFVHRQMDWIRARLREAEGKRIAPRRYATGETLLIRGREVTLEVRQSLFGDGEVSLRGHRLIVQVGPAADAETRREQTRLALQRWYVQEAVKDCRARFAVLGRRVGVQPQRVVVKDMTSRWGSCSSKGNVSISYRVVMASAEVMDYLIVHELCHLRHPNHSPAFWGLVAQVMPGYEAPKAWLRTHGHELRL